MEVISVENYEIGNGIEAIVEKDGKKYRAYLQLPGTGDSQHASTPPPNNFQDSV